MTYEAAPVYRRGRPLHDEAFPVADVVHNAYKLAIWCAARDSHRNICDRDAVKCDTCRNHALAIAEAKRLLNHGSELA